MVHRGSCEHQEGFREFQRRVKVFGMSLDRFWRPYQRGFEGVLGGLGCFTGSHMSIKEDFRVDSRRFIAF